MPSTTSYKRGDVVLIPFPFTDLTSSKRRPALIISSEVFNSTHDDVMVIGITSLVKLSKVVTLHQQLIVKQPGAIPESVLAEIRERVRNQF